ncbi:MAG: type II secretion system protein [Verrucomicrobiota bacterium]
MKPTRTKRKQGFTLIELLVVITIIAILASLSAPVLGRVQTSARVTKSVNDARQIATSLKLYAADHSGAYPRGEESSNEALRQLFPTYLDQERIFHNPSSFFCRPDPPDEEIGQDESGSNRISELALEPGECHYAYVSGYSSTDKSTYPILADGFTAEGQAYDENHPWWNVGKAVVVYLDGSTVPELLRKSDGRGEIKGRGKKSDQNLFAPGSLGRGVVLNPERP